MRLETKNNQSLILVMIFPLFFALLPRPDIAGFHFLTYSILAALFGLLSFVLISKNEISKSVGTPMMLMGMLMLLMLVSTLVNSGSLSNLSQLAKVILCAVVFIFGTLVGKIKDKDAIYVGLLRAAYIILFVQIIVSFTHLIGSDVFGWIYSTKKANSFATIVRVTGTFGNPNLFAWIVTQMAVIIYLFEKNKTKTYIWLFISLTLVFLSGSRSSLLLFPAVITFVYLIKNRKTAAFILFKLPFFLGFMGFLLYLGIQFLENNRQSFPYITQLLNLFETGDLTSVSSFNSRTFMWNDALHQMDSMSKWIFGLGPGSIEVLDNDYLYSLVNYGALFTLTNMILYLTFIYYFIKCKDRKFMTLGIQYIVFALIIGYQAETLSGWIYPMLIMFYSGIALSIRYKKGKEVEELTVAKNKPKRKRLRLVWE